MEIISNFFENKSPNTNLLPNAFLYSIWHVSLKKCISMTIEKKTLSFEQLPELIQNLVERIESLEKTVREKQQPQPLEGELMSVEDVCKLLGKSKSAVYRTVRCHDIPFIRQGNRLYFDRPTIKKWLEKKQNIECIRQMDEFEKFMTPDPWRYRNRR